MLAPSLNPQRISYRGTLTLAVRTMRIHLASSITSADVELGEIADASDLNVVGGLDEVRARDGAVGDEPCPVARLDAPCDLDTLGFSNSRAGAGLRRAVDTPVINTVDFDERSVSPACFRLGKRHTI